MRLAPLLLFPALVLACGDSARESACSVFDNGDGTRTIRCGADSLIVPASGDGTTCVKSPAEGGGSIIACTDGTTIVLDADGNVIHRGAGGVVGTVTLLGERYDGNAGIVVRAVGTEHSTVTDGLGRFYLPNLDAGVYDLVFERDGWEPVRLRNTIAVGGILHLDPFALRRGRQLAGADSSFVVSPVEDTVVVRDGRSLWLHFVDRIDPRQLSPDVPATLASWPMRPAYDPEGQAVVFLEGVDPASQWGRLRRHDIATGVTTTLAERAVRALPLAGGPVLIWRAPADAQHGPLEEAEVLVRYPDGTELAVGTAPIFPWESIAPGGLALVLDAGGETVVVDVEARTVFSPGTGARVAAWSPDGRKAVLASPTSETTATLLLLDLDTRGVVVIAAGALDGAQFSPDGSRVLFLANYAGEEEASHIGDLVVIDTRTFERLDAPEASRRFQDWRFTPDGAAVLYQRGAGSLVHWDFVHDRTTPVGSAPVSAVVESPRGDRLAFADADGSCRLLRIEADGSPGIFLVPSCERIHFLPDGERTAVIQWDEDALREVRLWSGDETGPKLAGLPGNAIDDPGIRFAADGSAVLWQDERAETRTAYVRGLSDDAEGAFPGSPAYSWVEFAQDGDFAVARTEPGELLVHQRASGQTFRIDGPVDSVERHRTFAVYRIVDEGEGRQGLWLSRYPHAPAE